MSSANNPDHQRSSSSRASRRNENDGQIQTNRSRSLPHRQVIIILTNNPEILHNSHDLQPQVNTCIMNRYSLVISPICI